MSPKLGIFCFFSLFVSLISGAKYLIDIDDGEEIDRHGGQEGEEGGGAWCYLEQECGAASWASRGDCGGTKQSPIDLVTRGRSYQRPAQPVAFTGYDKAASNQLVNNGHTLQVDSSGTLRLMSGGPLNGSYQMLQLHFHWGQDDSRGSEHTLDGSPFPLELHIVHKRTDLGTVEVALQTHHGLAVAGFFFEIGPEDNAALAPLIAALPRVQEKGSKVGLSGLSEAALMSGHTAQYASYSGSLTTPPCSQAVHWINFLQPLQISSSQLEQFRSLSDGKGGNIYDNFRPPQPLHGRSVTLYRSSSSSSGQSGGLRVNVAAPYTG